MPRFRESATLWSVDLYTPFARPPRPVSSRSLARSPFPTQLGFRRPARRSAPRPPCRSKVRPSDSSPSSSAPPPILVSFGADRARFGLLTAGNSGWWCRREGQAAQGAQGRQEGVRRGTLPRVVLRSRSVARLVGCLIRDLRLFSL